LSVQGEGKSKEFNISLTKRKKGIYGGKEGQEFKQGKLAVLGKGGDSLKEI